MLNTSSEPKLDSRKFAAEIMLQESEAIRRASKLLDERFDWAVDRMSSCTGNVIVSGVGKSGLIGKKISATLSSTGTPSHFMHPTEAMHGDLGRVGSKDVAFLLSFSGTTEELLSLAAILRQDSIPIISISKSRDSRLARLSDAALCVGDITEACPYNLAPTASTAAMLALGDALALAVSQRRTFSVEDFQKRHPGGMLGKKLMPVSEVLRFEVGKNVALASGGATVAEILADAERIPRRSGAILIVNQQGKLTGIFTDGDLRRLLAAEGAQVMQRTVDRLMTIDPIHLVSTDLVRDAIQLVREHRVDEIPVVDRNGFPVGILDVQDLVSQKLITD
ncbi:KpsF/GutQ family sugar-phosphate isomerase [Roseimaritima ulvae]|uniref:Arabinose 5-phosphate isomerase KdsD n=1 Tax=Roseimaritima ulvae TaxID=980254 RepID=A0A5B9QWV9_9BACT|nr:KpsF/GutQ family sugar-phosphate isomerase [Roseimaritima ulvae]QEG42482.1 Arabinose 5-phosphate isomerase KdsD [Roseimaritima ulvae]